MMKQPLQDGWAGISYRIARPIKLAIVREGEIVASRYIGEFDSLDEMANWFAAHKQRDASVIWKFFIGGAE